MVLLTLYFAIRDWLAAHNEALVILGAAATALTVILGLQSLASLEKKWPENSGASPQEKKREQRYFGLVRPQKGTKAWYRLIKSEAELTAKYGEDAISHLELSWPTFGRLRVAGFERVSELVGIFAEDPDGGLILARCSLFGPEKMAELKEKLDAYLDRQAADPQIKI